MMKGKPMKADELKLVLDSLTLVQSNADEVAKSFYKHLFEIAPQTKKLFTGDMERQGTMLMTSLSLAVSGLSNIDDILPSVQALGERHMSYGVKPEYFQPASESFIWALENHLGDQFTPALKAAWTLAFESLTKAMLDAFDS
jgi:hemoglobin-like flavoprotein